MEIEAKKISTNCLFGGVPLLTSLVPTVLGILEIIVQLGDN